MLTFDKFKEEILDWASNKRPESWRYGQAVFNYIDAKYGIARTVQFQDHVDCFYSNNLIDQFIEKSYKHYLELYNNE